MMAAHISTRCCEEVSSYNIVDLAHQAKFQASFRKVAGLPFDVPVNWPPPAEDKEIFTDGRGSYKVYCKIAGVIILSFPTEPKISFPLSETLQLLQPHSPSRSS
jgi:hypothetical protein